MKKKSQPSDLANLEAPVQLTPAQLETVAAGVAKQIAVKGLEDPTVLTGTIGPRIPIKQQFVVK